MREVILDKTEYIKKELAYQKLCAFEKSYFESIDKSPTGSIVYEIDATRLAELGSLTENDLKDLDFSAVQFPSYQRLFEAKYKNRFLKNIAAISPNDLQKKLGRSTIEEVTKADNEIKVKYAESIREIDLDNDGVPDRIDIDDTKNSVQTVADLDIVKNLTSKETSKVQDKKQKDDIER